MSRFIFRDVEGESCRAGVNNPCILLKVENTCIHVNIESITQKTQCLALDWVSENEGGRLTIPVFSLA